MTLFEHLDTQLRALLESTGSEVAYLPGEMLFGPTGPEWSGDRQTRTHTSHVLLC